MHIRKFSDEKILKIALKYGAQARQARQRFIGLLPEVNRRKLYEKKGCSSICEFGAKFAGLSREQVLRALNLERKFEDKPVLKSLFENGEVSMNKLVRVASIATKENEEILAVQTKLLSNRALETFVKDEKMAIAENENASQKPLFEAKSVHVHTLLIAEDVENELSKLQEKGIDINQLLREFLQKRMGEIEAEKQRLSDIAWSHRLPHSSGAAAGQKAGKLRWSDIAKSRRLRDLAAVEQKAKDMEAQNQPAEVGKSVDGCAIDKKSPAGKQQLPNQMAANDVAADDGFAPKKVPVENATQKKSPTKKPSRYVSVAVQTVQGQEFGNKCAIATCHNPIGHTHHGQRWGLAQVHDPKQMAPMCRQHHEIAHTLDLSYHKIKKQRCSH